MAWVNNLLAMTSVLPHEFTALVVAPIWQILYMRVTNDFAVVVASVLRAVRASVNFYCL